MLIVDAFLRFSGVGLMLFVSVLLLPHFKKSQTALLLLLVNISVTGHFLGFTPELFSWPLEFQWVFRFLDIFQLLLIWLVALSLFEKDFRFNGVHLLIGFIYTVALFAERLVQFQVIDRLPDLWAWLVNGSSLILVAHMVIVTLTGREDDLIELRRSSRVYFVLMLAFSALSVTLFGSILFSQYQPTIDVIGIWPAIVWSAYWLCRVPEGVFDFEKTTAEPQNTLSARDRDLQTRLNHEIIEQRCYLDSDLSIELLAKRLGVSAYRLREFINKTLGYANFSTFINGYRVEAIKQALAESENAHVPVLTIALNHGFNSLSPFNRAFKKVEGLTPSEFRKKLAQSSKSNSISPFSVS